MVVASTVWVRAALWLYGFVSRGSGADFGADQLLRRRAGEPDHWPKIAAVIPARDETETIAQAVQSVARHDYPAYVTIVVLDDGSTDGTAAEAKSGATGSGVIDVIQGQQLPDGWTGKMWAVSPVWKTRH